MKQPSAFHVFLAVLGVVGLLSLGAPTRYLRWVNDLAAVVRLPTVPFALAGTKLQVWLRGSDDAPLGAEHDLAHYRSEMHNYLALYHAERLRARALQERIEQLERTRIEGGNVEFKPVTASIVGRNTQSGGEVFELNVGSSTVQPNAVAVYDGSHLIGRISAVHPLTSLLIPITDPAIGPLQAAITPEGADDERALADQTLTLLTARGDGTLEGEVEREAGVMVRDFVLLDDPTWPRTGRAMIIGRVISVESIEESPLRQRIVVQPSYLASRLSSVTVKVEQTGARAVGASEDGS